MTHFLIEPYHYTKKKVFKWFFHSIIYNFDVFNYNTKQNKWLFMIKLNIVNQKTLSVNWEKKEEPFKSWRLSSEWKTKWFFSPHVILYCIIFYFMLSSKLKKKRGNNWKSRVINKGVFSLYIGLKFFQHTGTLDVNSILVYSVILHDKTETKDVCVISSPSLLFFYSFFYICTKWSI